MARTILRRVSSLGLAAAAVLTGVCGLAGPAMADTLFTKFPDQGDFWEGLGHPGVYVFWDSFVMPAGPDTTLNQIGIWLLDGGTQVKFQIEGDKGSGFGPDASKVLTSSDVFSTVNSALTLDTLDVTPVALTPGTKYWVTLTDVGLGGTGQYTVGGHTRNTGGINDNGTFWSDRTDPTGYTFNNGNLIPEMAYQLNFTTIPEPASLSLLGVSSLVLLARRRRV